MDGASISSSAANDQLTQPLLAGARAVIYIRVSTGAQEANYSLDTQRAACELFASERGFTVINVVTETFSGVTLWERPALSQLRQRIKANDIDRVICYDLDRLSRDPEHLIILLNEAEFHGVQYEFVREPLDDSPEGALVRFVRGYAARREHSLIKERTQRGKHARVKSGIPLAARRASYGFAWDDTKKRLLENPSTADVVRRIFADYLQGKTFCQIAFALSREGIPTASGKSQHWHPEVIGQILRNPQYVDRGLGWVTGNYARKRKPQDCPDAVRFPEGTFPRLVSDEDFAAVQRRMEKNKERASRNNKQPHSALLRGGLVTCAYCGGRLHVSSVTRQKGGNPFTLTNYVCDGYRADPGRCPKPSISVRSLDGAIWERVSTLLKRPEVIIAELRRSHATDPVAKDLKVAERELSASLRRQSNLAASIAVTDDEDVRLLLLTDLADESAQRKRLTVERDTLLDRQHTWNAGQTDLSDLARWCDAMAASVDDLDYETRRLLLDALDVSVKVAKSTDQERPRWQITAALPLDRPLPLTPEQTIQPNSSAIVTCTT